MLLWSCALGHLLVDGVCAATLFGPLAAAPNRTTLLLLYTTLAFSTQGIVGLMADRLRRHGLAGCAAMLLLAGCLALPLPATLRACLLGLGNSVFHVAGGALTLERSAGKAGKLGVFVAPGAVGLTLGTLWPGLGPLLAVALAAAAVWFYAEARRAAPVPREEPQVVPDAALARVPLLALLSLAVAVRAIGGTAVHFPWKTGSAMALLTTAFVFAGKSLGGFLCDRIGPAKSAWVSIVPAMLLIAFCARWAAPSLLGQFALNLTMPVTLWLLYRLLPDAPGFAFGLAASALWPGTLLGHLMTVTGPALWLCVLVSFGFGLWAILHAVKKLQLR